MSNLDLSREVLRTLAARGMAEVVLCAGARNAPLVTVLSAADEVRTYSFFDERGAAFFALGRILATGRPVAVITTSGTAVAETLPAVIEADLQGLPLVIISADRPRRYRGTGAPQTITQPGLFSVYVERTLDIEGAWDADAVNEWTARRPLHVNVCFDEPLIDQPNPRWSCAPEDPTAPPAAGSTRAATLAARRPLIIASGLTTAEAARVKPWLAGCGRPLWLEATSQLRGDPDLAELEITGGDAAAVAHDGIVRVGGVPTLRRWRDLEKTGLPVAHFSRTPFAGLPGTHRVHPLTALTELGPFDATDDLGPDRARAARLDQLLALHPASEPAWVRRLSAWIPRGARVFLGNSLPIREWDLAAARDRDVAIFANRGANGIDGLISTFAGVADPARSNWAVLGDLSTLYDLGGPWALRERPIDDLTIAVINNGGGKIFTRLFGDPRFENRHDLNFAPFAAQWSLTYQAIDDPADQPRVTGPRVLEIKPDARETAAFWSAWEAK